jgi:hypothetical protein
LKKNKKITYEERRYKKKKKEERQPVLWITHSRRSQIFAYLRKCVCPERHKYADMEQREGAALFLSTGGASMVC